MLLRTASRALDALTPRLAWGRPLAACDSRDGVSRRAACQTLRLPFAPDARLDERVIPGPVLLHRFPLGLFADCVHSARLPADGGLVDDPRSAPPRLLVHRPLHAPGWPARGSHCPALTRGSQQTASTRRPISPGHPSGENTPSRRWCTTGRST